MTEFNRVDPMPVPENWREKAKALIKLRDEYFDSDKYKNLKDPRKSEQGWQPNHPDVPPVEPKIEEVLSYFETLAAVPQVSQARVRLYSLTRSNNEWYPDSSLINDFISWWLCEFTDYPFYEHHSLGMGIDLLVRKALVEYVNSGDICQSYELIFEALEEKKRYRKYFMPSESETT